MLSYTIVSLIGFLVDMILGILSGESYSGIHVLADLYVCVKNTNKLSDAVAGKTVTELTTSLT